jgi:hypothetical protein
MPLGCPYPATSCGFTWRQHRARQTDRLGIGNAALPFTRSVRKATSRRDAKGKPTMSPGTTVRRGELTAYESDQVRDIALWKSEPPNPLSELWKMVVVPVAKTIAWVVPNPLIRLSIDMAYDAAALLAGEKGILLQAGVRELSELREKPLDECDRLAGRVGVVAESLACVEGAATGFGGIWTTALDVPVLFALALRTIIKIGHCYGYPLAERRDRHFVLGVLNVATAGSLEMRLERLSQLRELDDYLLAETEVNMVKEEALSFLFQLEIFEDVPGIGAVTGALLNLTFMRRVELTARRVFQERWLLDNAKIEGALEPAAAPARLTATGWSGAMGRAVYGGCYYAGFAATVPFWLAASALRSSHRALSRGQPDGLNAPVEALEGTGRANGRAADRRGQPVIAPA